MGAMRPWHWIVILVLLILLFGANKLPEIAGSVGKSMKVFKKEVKELRDDEPSTSAPQAQIPPQQGTYYTQPTQPGQAAPSAQPQQQFPNQDGSAPSQ
ncbi:Sec-independent protein translocase subunit TatA [Actinomyces vulturis]|uniref:Sec-independent protein translocase subunit TatA n=1 Tax=Actinomyces vulturis TaxID=1857645 RepID=UPI000835D1B9|nr:Sec-independent protein translocase subunit TatA [Actinomyces vulturis]